jgi:hypothetical protein
VREEIGKQMVEIKIEVLNQLKYINAIKLVKL